MDLAGLRTSDEVVSSITLLVNEVKRRAEALTCNEVAGKPEGRNGNNKTVSAISLFRYAEGVNLAFPPPFKNSHDLAINRLHTFQIHLVDFIPQTYYTHLTYTHEISIYHPMSKHIKTPTIGEILNEEFFTPMGLSAYKVAQAINVPVSRIQDILHDRRRITVDTSLRLAKFFGVSDDYFISLQDDIDIRNLKIEIASELDKIKTFEPV